MTELKTLQDISMKPLCSGDICSSCLRPEVIKWAQNLHNPSAPIEALFSVKYGINDCQSALKWLMHFFNLTEDDLK